MRRDVRTLRRSRACGGGRPRGAHSTQRRSRSRRRVLGVTATQTGSQTLRVCAYCCVRRPTKACCGRCGRRFGDTRRGTGWRCRGGRQKGFGQDLRLAVRVLQGGRRAEGCVAGCTANACKQSKVRKAVCSHTHPQRTPGTFRLVFTCFTQNHTITL